MVKYNMKKPNIVKENILPHKNLKLQHQGEKKSIKEKHLQHMTKGQCV